MKHLKRKLICIVLTVSAVLFALPFSVGAALPSYNAEKDYKTAQGSVWRYQIGYNNNGYYGFTDCNFTENRWGDYNVGVIQRVDDDMVINKPAILMHSGAVSDPVLTFVAPYSGTVEISMTNGGVYCPLNGKEQEFDGINFYMCCGSQKVASFEGVSAKNSEMAKRVFADVYTVDIAKGECIYFIVQPNKSTANDKVTLNPEIVYKKLSNKPAVKPTVPAYIGNRATVAPSGGNKVSIASTVTGGEKDGVYRISQVFGPDMEHWKFYWENSNVQYAMELNDGVYRFKQATYGSISEMGTKWHPHIAGYDVLTFTCPASGRVRVGSECTMEVRADTADGVNIKVISERNILGDTYLLDANNPKQEFKPIEFDVYKGQKISFYFDMNINNASDLTTFAPYVKYLEYKDVKKYDTGKYDEYVDPADDGKSRTDMDVSVKEEEDGINVNNIIIGAVAALVVVGIIVAVTLVVKRRKSK